MAARADIQDSSSDKLKLIAAAVIGVVGLVAFYTLPVESLLVKVLMLLVVAAIVVTLVYMTATGTVSYTHLTLPTIYSV